MGHNHNHHHDHHSDGHKNIRLAFFLNLLFTVLEIVGGLLTNSMAILSDALHDLGDSLSLGIAWYFQRYSEKEAGSQIYVRICAFFAAGRADKQYCFGRRVGAHIRACHTSAFSTRGSQSKRHAHFCDFGNCDQWNCCPAVEEKYFIE